MQRNGHGARVGPIVLGVLALAVTRAGAASDQESWDAIYVARSKVGHTHVRVEPIKDSAGRPVKDSAGHELIRVRVDWEVSFKRKGDQADMRLMYGTIETPDGTVLKLDTRTYSGEVETMRTFGEVAGERMNLTVQAGGREESKAIPWSPDVRGPYGAELSLARTPLAPGESRDVKTYIPDLNQVCLTRLKAKHKEKVELGRGITRELLRVEQTVSDLDGKPLPGIPKSILWVDRGGQIIKSSTDMLGGMVTYRTTEAGAKAPNGGSFDLVRDLVVRVPTPIADPERTRDVVYRVTLRGDNPAEALPGDQRQSLRPGTGKETALLEVRTDGVNAGTPGPSQADDKYLRPSPLINSDDPRVQSHMRRAVGNRVDPWEKAVAIEEWVFNNMQKKNFSTAFATASEVARDLSGDCTEHGVLTAAMCRAAGIPARCVVGLVYVTDLGGFGFHMWNEVYVNRRWVALDATFNQFAVDATHIKLSDTSLDGISPLDAMLVVIRVMDHLSIQPVEVR
jgi:hypothetical protein